MIDDKLIVKLGARVLIKPEVRERVGAAEGVVVGIRREPPAPGVIVCTPGTGPANQVIAPEDIEQPET